MKIARNPSGKGPLETNQSWFYLPNTGLKTAPSLGQEVEQWCLKMKKDTGERHQIWTEQMNLQGASSWCGESGARALEALKGPRARRREHAGLWQNPFVSSLDRKIPENLPLEVALDFPLSNLTLCVHFLIPIVQMEKLRLRKLTFSWRNQILDAQCSPLAHSRLFSATVFVHSLPWESSPGVLVYFHGMSSLLTHELPKLLFSGVLLHFLLLQQNAWGWCLGKKARVLGSGPCYA